MSHSNTQWLFHMVPSMFKWSGLLLLLGLLIACEGAETVANRLGVDTELADYTGPAPANNDVLNFQDEIWQNLRQENRCGQCHGSGGQEPTFADSSNVNDAYNEILAYINRDDPSGSALVTKVNNGHNCWEAVDSVCADSIENMISSWVGGATSSTTARVIPMVAPDVLINPGDSKNFPANATDNAPDSFADTVHPLLVANCINCHYEEGIAQQQAPFFANPDSASAYEAARSKINIDLPSNSRLVQRLLDGHNCWDDCGTYNATTDTATGDSGVMLAAINQFSGAIVPVQIDVNLVTSKAMQLADGIIATGGNRHEADLLALWEFKVGTGGTAFDTSGVEPAINLTLDGSVTWLSNYGLEFSGGKAQADTGNSRKLHDQIKLTTQYAIETWVLPANVTQQDANIVSYDAGSAAKNFALTQYEYSYRLHNRNSPSNDANGLPFISSEDAGEILQTSLQHVVVNYHPIDGRSIYVNGERIAVDDPVTESTTLSNWENNFSLVFGNSSSSMRPWQGQLRMVAIHDRALTQEQVTENFSAGVGQKYFLLFSIADHTGIDDTYIRMEVSQFDNFSYLFENPTFINLDQSWTPGGFDIQRLRIGINGKQAIAGQSFANLSATINANDYDPVEGQLLSPRGAVIALEKGAGLDEFFLTFELLNLASNAFVEASVVAPPTPPDAVAVSDIGVRTFDEINASLSAMTGISATNVAVDSVYQQYRQQLPAVETIDAFLSSHQMAIAQLALTYCSERVDADRSLAVGDPAREMFTNMDFTEAANTAFDSVAKRANAIDPILSSVLLNNLNSQPATAEISDLLGATTPQTLTTTVGSYNFDSLITTMTACPVPADPDFPCDLNTDINTPARTVQIVKAMCAAAMGSAAMLIQ